MQRRQGCLGGLFDLLLLGTIYDWLQHNVGFGRGCSCSGCGCGCLLMIVAFVIFLKIIFGVDWFRPLCGFM